MAYTMRVTVPGADVLTETDPNKFALRTDDAAALIKEKARGSVTLANATTSTIAHGLGYIPMVLVWGEDQGGNLIYGADNPGFDTHINSWRVELDATNLLVSQLVDANNRTFKYFIFYDQVG